MFSFARWPRSPQLRCATVPRGRRGGLTVSCDDAGKFGARCPFALPVPDQCLPQISSVDGGGRAQGCKIKCPDTRFTRSNREAREIRTAIGEQEEHFAIGQ